jgi:excisionase family DNA binding protein
MHLRGSVVFEGTVTEPMVIGVGDGVRQPHFMVWSMNSVVPTRTEETPRRGYRITEAARYMGVSPWFVELKVRSGELPALKLCRHYTILREDMDDFLGVERKKAVSRASVSLAIQ